MPRPKKQPQQNLPTVVLPLLGDIVDLQGELTAQEDAFAEVYYPACTMMKHDEAVSLALREANYSFENNTVRDMAVIRLIRKIEMNKSHKDLMAMMGFGPTRIIGETIRDWMALLQNRSDSGRSEMARVQFSKLLFSAQGMAEDTETFRPTSVTMIFPSDEQEVVASTLKTGKRGRPKKISGPEDDTLTLTVKRREG